MPERTLSVLDGSTFVVGDRNGDVRADEGREHGFFSDDTRFLARWVLRVGAAPLQLLGLDQGEHYAARFFLAPSVGPDDAAPWSVMRRRLVDEVWIEEFAVTNHRHTPIELRVVLEAGTDFADLFEVKDGGEIAREIVARHDDRSLVLAYEHERFERSVEIVSSVPAEIADDGFAFTVPLRPGEEWAVTFTVTPRAAQPGATFPARGRRGPFEQLRRAKQAELAGWLARAPELRAQEPSLARTYRASLTDLGALRMHPHLHDGATLPAAGLPWFMALFGRDSLITSLQALPYLPSLAATTLRALATRQSAVHDDFHDQEPGKILHELRFGELTVRGARPQSPYYGTADATPLFLVLLDEYHRWSGDDALVRALEPNARAALAWIEESGDADGDGYVEYERRNRESGLVNQCWKDSWDAIQFADGRLAVGPIATCEIQGYVYDARRRAARLAREVWDDPTLAEQLERQAADLRARFHHDFWIPERGAYALALDGDKRRVDGLTSNIGHLLWSGLLDEEGAAATAAQLLEPQLWSGWGCARSAPAKAATTRSATTRARSGRTTTR